MINLREEWLGWDNAPIYLHDLSSCSAVLLRWDNQNGIPIQYSGVHITCLTDRTLITLALATLRDQHPENAQLAEVMIVLDPLQWRDDRNLADAYVSRNDFVLRILFLFGELATTIRHVNRGALQENWQIDLRYGQDGLSSRPVGARSDQERCAPADQLRWMSHSGGSHLQIIPAGRLPNVLANDEEFVAVNLDVIQQVMNIEDVRDDHDPIIWGPVPAVADNAPHA